MISEWEVKILAADENLVRIVHITRAFALSETEVTQAQYQAVMGTTHHGVRTHRTLPSISGSGELV